MIQDLLGEHKDIQSDTYFKALEILKNNFIVKPSSITGLKIFNGSVMHNFRIPSELRTDLSNKICLFYGDEISINLGSKIETLVLGNDNYFKLQNHVLKSIRIEKTGLIRKHTESHSLINDSSLFVERSLKDLNHHLIFSATFSPSIKSFFGLEENSAETLSNNNIYINDVSDISFYNTMNYFEMLHIRSNLSPKDFVIASIKERFKKTESDCKTFLLSLRHD